MGRSEPVDRPTRGEAWPSRHGLPIAHDDARRREDWRRPRWAGQLMEGEIDVATLGLLPPHGLSLAIRRGTMPMNDIAGFRRQVVVDEDEMQKRRRTRERQQGDHGRDHATGAASLRSPIAVCHGSHAASHGFDPDTSVWTQARHRPVMVISWPSTTKPPGAVCSTSLLQPGMSKVFEQARQKK